MKASDWISVKDRLPDTTHNESFSEYSNEVIICLNGCEIVVAILVSDKYNKTKYFLSSIGGYTYPIGIVTHWQPIVLPKKRKGMRNIDRYRSEIDANFDIQEEEAEHFSKGYKHLAGYITFFMAECPQCGCTMPFELDEGVCMKCNSDPAEGIVDDMSDSELDELLQNNRYHLKLPYVRRQPFETLPQMLARQVEYRCNEAIKKYNYENPTLATESEVVRND